MDIRALTDTISVSPQISADDVQQIADHVDTSIEVDLRDKGSIDDAVAAISALSGTGDRPIG